MFLKRWAVSSEVHIPWTYFRKGIQTFESNRVPLSVRRIPEFLGAVILRNAVSGLELNNSSATRNQGDPLLSCVKMAAAALETSLGNLLGSHVWFCLPANPQISLSQCSMLSHLGGCGQHNPCINLRRFLQTELAHLSKLPSMELWFRRECSVPSKGYKGMAGIQLSFTWYDLLPFNLMVSYFLGQRLYLSVQQLVLDFLHWLIYPPGILEFVTPCGNEFHGLIQQYGEKYFFLFLLLVLMVLSANLVC